MYEGWSNRATWNVWLWLNNDEPLYRALSDYIKHCAKRGISPSYRKMIEYVGLDHKHTPDGYAYISRHLSFRELNRAIAEELAEYKKFHG